MTDIKSDDDIVWYPPSNFVPRDVFRPMSARENLLVSYNTSYPTRACVIIVRYQLNTESSLETELAPKAP